LEGRKRVKREAHPFGKSWYIGSYSNIPVKVHWSFGLLLLFIVYTILTNEMKMWQAIAYTMLVFAVFACVIMHEYGHALTGQKFGVKTVDIIITPIGGLARMNRIPDHPAQEFLITLAGPMVNLIIAIVIGFLFYIVTGKFSLDMTTYNLNHPTEFIRLLVPINLTLFLFNLIPAFPMDGGRILRSLLAVKFGKVRATRIATQIGKLLAIGFIIFGIFDQQIILALIGLFIFMMANQEYDQTKLLSIIGHTTVSELMQTSFTRLHLGDTYQSLIEKYQNGERNFLVFDSIGNLSGTVPELFIKDFIDQEKDPTLTVNQQMSSKTRIIDPAMLLKDAIDTMRDDGLAILAIGDENNIIGVLDRNTIEKYLRSKAG